MANVVDHTPHLVIVKKSFPRRHSAHTDAILDNPFQLAVRVFLNVGRAKVRYGRRHILREWHADRVTIEPVTDLTVASEVFGPDLDARSIIRNRVTPILAIDY